MNPWRSGGSVLRVSRFRRDFNHLLDGPLAVRPIGRLLRRVSVPQPDRRGQILQRHDHAGKSVGARRIVSGSQLEHHLLLGAEIELLQMTSPAHIPHVQLASVLAGEQQLGIDSVFHHVGCAPGAADHRVEPEVPPDVVRQFLRSAIELPSSTNLERLRIEQERAARTVAVGRAERADENPVRPAVHGVWRRVTRAPGDGLRLDDLHDSRLSGIGLRVKNVNAG